MRILPPCVLCLVMVSQGCASAPAAKPTARSPSGREAPGEPFEAVHPVRGPGLHLDGMTLVGGHATADLTIVAFDEGREIVFFVRRTPLTPADWLDACPPSQTAPGERRLAVRLEGVGDISRSAVYEHEGLWSASIPVDQYVLLRALRFDVCGQSYGLANENEHGSRIALHARMASERAGRKRQQEGALPGACQSGDGAACREAGELVLDLREQRRLYERACGLHDHESCARLADMLLQGKGGDKDPGQAIRLLEQGCQAGHDGSCLGAARAVIQRPSAWPTPAAEGRYRQGALLAARACELGGDTLAVSCLWAAELHATGFGVPADPRRVGAFATRSCRADYDKACRLQPALAACAGGSGEACAELAERTRRSRHRALRDDGTEALWRLAACRRGHAASCASPAK